MLDDGRALRERGIVHLQDTQASWLFETIETILIDIFRAHEDSNHIYFLHAFLNFVNRQQINFLSFERLVALSPGKWVIEEMYDRDNHLTETFHRLRAEASTIDTRYDTDNLWMELYLYLGFFYQDVMREIANLNDDRHAATVTEFADQLLSIAKIIFKKVNRFGRICEIEQRTVNGVYEIGPGTISKLRQEVKREPDAQDKLRVISPTVVISGRENFSVILQILEEIGDLDPENRFVRVAMMFFTAYHAAINNIAQERVVDGFYASACLIQLSVQSYPLWRELYYFMRGNNANFEERFDESLRSSVSRFRFISDVVCEMLDKKLIDFVQCDLFQLRERTDISVQQRSPLLSHHLHAVAQQAPAQEEEEVPECLKCVITQEMLPTENVKLCELDGRSYSGAHILESLRIYQRSPVNNAALKGDPASVLFRNHTLLRLLRAYRCNDHAEITLSLQCPITNETLESAVYNKRDGLTYSEAAITAQLQSQNLSPKDHLIIDYNIRDAVEYFCAPKHVARIK